jgi:tRNA 2-thiocytidine biosynthesis protein TtcA
MASLLPQFLKINSKYSLIADGQKILLAVSGGIDSLVMCRLLAELRTAAFPRLELQAAYVRIAPVALPDEMLENLRNILANWQIPFAILESEPIPGSQFDCYACARERRKQLFRLTADGKFNALAYGHNLDDYLETGLMNLLFNGSLESLRPVQLLCDEQIRVIRPLLGIAKKHIKANGRDFSIAALPNCRFAADNKRESVRLAIRQFSHINPHFNVNLRRAINRWNQLEI